MGGGMLCSNLAFFAGGEVLVLDDDAGDFDDGVHVTGDMAEKEDPLTPSLRDGETIARSQEDLLASAGKKQKRA